MFAMHPQDGYQHSAYRVECHFYLQEVRHKHLIKDAENEVRSSKRKKASKHTQVTKKETTTTNSVS